MSVGNLEPELGVERPAVADSGTVGINPHTLGQRIAGVDLGQKPAAGTADVEDGFGITGYLTQGRFEFVAVPIRLERVFGDTLLVVIRGNGIPDIF